MKKLIIIIPILLFLLTACTTSGVDNTIYDEGNAIIQMTADNVKSGQMEFSKSQQMKVDDFQSKYINKGWKADNKDFQYFNLVFLVYMSYSQYGADQQLEYLNKYNESLNELKTKFNIKID